MFIVVLFMLNKSFLPQSHKNILLHFLIIVISSNYCPESIFNFCIYCKVTLYFYYISYKNIVLTLIKSSFSLSHWFAEVPLQIPNSHMVIFLDTLFCYSSTDLFHSFMLFFHLVHTEVSVKFFSKYVGQTDSINGLTSYTAFYSVMFQLFPSTCEVQSP